MLEIVFLSVLLLISLYYQREMYRLGVAKGRRLEHIEALNRYLKRLEEFERAPACDCSCEPSAPTPESPGKEPPGKEAP